jgi:hypothetical protein
MAIQFEELKKYSETHADLNWRGYSISIDQEPFTFLFVGPEAYTLAWNGRVDFSKIDDEALLYLPVQLFSEPVSSQDEIDVSFIVADYRDILTQYSLNDPEELSRYKKDVRIYTQLLFARYDVNWSRSHSYSFIAQNAERARPAFRIRSVDVGHFQRVRKDYNELAVKLARGYSISEKLLMWIVERHVDEKMHWRLTDGMNLTLCADLIRKLT